MAGTHTRITGYKFANGAGSQSFIKAFGPGEWNGTPYDVFDRLYHEYDYMNEICSLATEGCTPDIVFKYLLVYPAPTASGVNPVSDGSRSDACKGVPLLDCPVSHRVFPKSRTIINQTLPGHPFHDGYVERSVVVKDGKVYIRSRGEGINRSTTSDLINELNSRFNERSAEPAWERVDRQIEDSVLYDAGRNLPYEETLKGRILEKINTRIYL